MYQVFHTGDYTHWIFGQNLQGLLEEAIRITRLKPVNSRLAEPVGECLD